MMRFIWSAVVVAMFLTMVDRPVAAAQGDAVRLGADVLSVLQEDVDGDRLPDITRIDAAFATERDQVVVYDGERNMQWSDQWNLATDQRDDIWVFDVGADGTAQLIIVFRVENDDAVAYLWGDVDGDGIVRHDIIPRLARIREDANWELRVEAQGSWWTASNQMNLNVSWSLDGCGTCEMLPGSVRDMVSERLPRDGNPDFVGRVVDANADGIPDYTYSVLQTQLPPEIGIPRSSAQLNYARAAPSPPHDYVFWPFLLAPDAPEPTRYFAQSPTVRVNWETAEIGGGVVIDGYPTERGLHINTVSPWLPDEINEASFENAMAYYDLAEDNDGDPELHVRLDYVPAEHLYLGNDSPRAVEGIRYSWNQANTPGLVWDYKIGLAGLHEIDETVSLDEYDIRTIPYDRLPAWVVDRTWEWQTFVASEPDAYVSSEGIYEWGIGASSREQDYLTGASVESPVGVYSDILPGLRAEVSMAAGRRPELYFSPVDGRLHLLFAESGVYNAGAESRIVYRNLDGDAYIDTWERYRNDPVEGEYVDERLVQIDGGAIYVANGDVRFVATTVPREEFRAVPPSDRQSFIALSQLLEQYESLESADDLETAFAQLGDAPSTMRNASMSGLRMSTSELRFVLDLRRGYSIEGFPISGVNGPGRYVVIFDRDARTFVAARSSGAQPSLAIDSDTSDVSAQSPLTVTISMASGGNEDLLDGSLVANARIAGGKSLPITGPDRVMIPAGETTAWEGVWRPPSPGAWTITAKLLLPGGEILEQTQEIEVLTPARPSWQSVIVGGWPSTPPIGYLGGLAGIVGATAAGGILLVRRVR